MASFFAQEYQSGARSQNIMAEVKLFQEEKFGESY
jgi:hypothetical protein